MNVLVKTQGREEVFTVLKTLSGNGTVIPVGFKLENISFSDIADNIRCLGIMDLYCAQPTIFAFVNRNLQEIMSSMKTTIKVASFAEYMLNLYNDKYTNTTEKLSIEKVTDRAYNFYYENRLTGTDLKGSFCASDIFSACDTAKEELSRRTQINSVKLKNDIKANVQTVLQMYLKEHTEETANALTELLAEISS